MELKLNEPLTFGMYNGRTIDEMLPENMKNYDGDFSKRQINWLEWVQNNTEHTLSEEVKNRIKIIKNARNTTTRSFKKKSNLNRRDMPEDDYGDWGWECHSFLYKIYGY